MKKKLLIVDNDSDYLETWVGILKRAGYEVKSAASSEGAERILTHSWVHLAIIDVRLRKNTDTRDTSGLALAKKAPYRRIPKIILTRYPTYDQVRKALGPALEGLPPAVDFVNKMEGKKAILSAVERAFENYVRINWDLEIKFDEPARLSFHHLADLIEPGLERACSSSRAEELEDVFRQAFFQERAIRIDRVLWQSEGRVALRVFAFAAEQPVASWMVVCGLEPRLSEEARAASDFATNSSSLQRTNLRRSAGATHLAANVYLLVGADLENIRSLAELYRSGPEKTFNKALESLYQETLAPCFNEKYLSEEWDSIGKLCRARFSLSDLTDHREAFERRLRAIAAQAPRLDTKIEFAPGCLTFHFGNQAFSYPDPLDALRRDFEFPLLVNAPVISSGERLLTDASGKVWMTDITRAVPMPISWNFAAVESLIRFDWIEPVNPQWLHELEKCLIAGFTLLDLRDLAQPLRLPARAIQAVRRLADGVIGHDHAIYHWGTLFAALHRLTGFDPASPLTRNDLTRLLHALLAAAVVSDKLSRPAVRARSAARGITIDKENRAVSVRGQRVRMRGQGYDLLCFLYDRPGQLRTPREIVEQVFQENYREEDSDQKNRLFVAVRRLRMMIEDDPGNPRYLLNEPGGGYRLVIAPQ